MRHNKISDSVVHIGVMLVTIICIAVILSTKLGNNNPFIYHNPFTLNSANIKTDYLMTNDNLKISFSRITNYTQNTNYMYTQILLNRLQKNDMEIEDIRIYPFESITIKLKYSQTDHNTLRQSSKIAIVRPWLQSYTAGNLAKHQTYEETQTDNKI